MKDSIGQSRYQWLAVVFCFVFGLILIFNAMATADGTWFWYAVLFRKGERLYSHLHLVQQPFFILDTAGFLALTGNGWLAFKMQSIVHLAIYVLGFFALARYLPMTDRQRAILIAAAFFASINSVACRFDDYHVVAESLAVYSVVLLLELYHSTNLRKSMAIALLLGAFAALSFETRINNGAALFLGSAMAIACLAPARRWTLLGIFSSAAAATAWIVVILTGDSLHDYWLYSFVKAAAIKGGSGSVLISPLRLLLDTARYFEIHIYTFIVAYFLLVCAIWVYILKPAFSKPVKERSLRIITASVLVLAPLLEFRRHSVAGGKFLLGVAIVPNFLLYGLGAAALFRWMFAIFRRRSFAGRWNKLEALLFIPLGQLASEAMSAGGRHGESYAPMALFLLLLPIASPVRLRERGRSFLLAGACIIAGWGFFQRTIVPYRWLSYYSKPLFVGRQWYQHPVYGPMYIERDLLGFVEPICQHMTQNGSHAELLSTPYSFANYFCDVPPWHDYVQTWYDTSSQSTIQGLIAELQQAPPQWVLYERQPVVLALHEMVYDKGHPTPHRQLDNFLDQKIESGQWKIVYKSTYASTPTIPQEWWLIQTWP